MNKNKFLIAINGFSTIRPNISVDFVFFFKSSLKEYDSMVVEYPKRVNLFVRFVWVNRVIGCGSIFWIQESVDWWLLFFVNIWKCFDAVRSNSDEIFTLLPSVKMVRLFDVRREGSRRLNYHNLERIKAKEQALMLRLDIQFFFPRNFRLFKLNFVCWQKFIQFKVMKISFFSRTNAFINFGFFSFQSAEKCTKTNHKSHGIRFNAKKNIKFPRLSTSLSQHFATETKYFI